MTHQEATRLASEALDAGRQGRHADAAVLVQRINDAAGGTGLIVAMLVWAGRWLDHALGALGSKVGGGDVRAHLRTFGDGPYDNPESIAWASDVLAAYAAGQRSRMRTLFESVPDDPDIAGVYVLAVLALVTKGFELPEGYAAAAFAITQDQRRQ